MSIPEATPLIMEVGILKKFKTSKEPEEARDVNEVNNTMTNTSSTDAPAIINCGIPSFVP